MRTAVISDIHGNLEALQTVMLQIAAQKCDRIICLGDLVGYGPNPSECLRMLSEAGVPCIKGNHDEACASETFPYRMNAMASAAVLWTQQQLSAIEKLWLNSLPYTLQLDGATYVHASPHQPPEWEYVLDAYEAELAFRAFDDQVCFIGHSHEPVAWVATDIRIEGEHYDRLHLEPRKRYVINVGSVGQPRDRDPRAAFVIHDSANGYVELHRVPYEVEKTQGKILGAGLPAVLAQRLELGR